MAGVLLGGAFIRSVQQRLAAYEDIEFGALQGSAGASRAGEHEGREVQGHSCEGGTSLGRSWTARSC